MQSSVGRIFLMNCINQANIFGFWKQVIVDLQVKRKIGFTFENPWNHLHIADIVFSKIFSHVSYVNSLYSIINLDSWWCLVLQYLSVSCLVLVVKHCLSTNLTLSKGMFLTFFFINLYQHVSFTGMGLRSLSFFIIFEMSKG